MVSCKFAGQRLGRAWSYRGIPGIDADHSVLGDAVALVHVFSVGPVRET